MSLINTRVTADGLAHLEGLSQLQVLWISGTRIGDAGIPHLSKLQELKILTLMDTQVSDAGLASLQSLGELDTLYLSGNEITDSGMTRLKRLQQLKDLALIGTEVTDVGLAQLIELTQLQALSVVCPRVTDTGLKALTRLTQLERLTLSSTQVTDAGLDDLKAFTHLYSLDLSETKITDHGLVQLHALTHLKSLDVSGTKVTQQGVKMLQQAMPRCEIETRAKIDRARADYSKRAAATQVSMEVGELHSVQFKSTSTLPDPPAQTVTMEIIFDSLGHARTTVRHGDVVLSISIDDLRTGRSLTLHPKDKRAELREMVNLPADRKVPNLLKEYANIHDKDGTPVGEKVIDGRKTKGFKIITPAGEETVWADIETRLPVQIVGPQMTNTDFRWNLPLE